MTIAFARQSRIRIGSRLMCVVAAFLAVEVTVGFPASSLAAASPSLLKTLLAGPRFNQRSVHSEVLIGNKSHRA